MREAARVCVPQVALTAVMRKLIVLLNRMLKNPHFKLNSVPATGLQKFPPNAGVWGWRSPNPNHQLLPNKIRCFPTPLLQSASREMKASAANFHAANWRAQRTAASTTFLR